MEVWFLKQAFSLEGVQIFRVFQGFHFHHSSLSTNGWHASRLGLLRLQHWLWTKLLTPLKTHGTHCVIEKLAEQSLGEFSSDAVNGGKAIPQLSRNVVIKAETLRIICYLDYTRFGMRASSYRHLHTFGSISFKAKLCHQKSRRGRAP